MRKNEFINLLVESGIEKNEAAAEVELVLEFVLNKTKEELLFIQDFDTESIMPLIKDRIETKKPIQYILKMAPFMGEKFFVNENVLIPRDDTETLVHKTKNLAGKNSKILDIGCGSGIISCILAKSLKDAKVLGIDISDDAITISNKNAKNLNLDNVEFKKSDLFSNIKDKFDIIVSNPPYIPKSYKSSIQNEVKFEPDLALYTDDEDGLYFYKKITKEAPNFLNNNGFLLFEMMMGQYEKLENILKENGFIEIEIIKDIQGIERVIKGKKAAS